MKKTVYLCLSILLLSSCSSSKTFKLNVNGEDLRFNQLELICLDCQNNDSQIEAYNNKLLELKETHRKTMTWILSNYGASASNNIYTKYTLPINVEIASTENEINHIKANKCYRYSISIAENNNCYIFVAPPKSLTYLDGVYYKEISKLILHYRYGFAIEFIPFSTSSIVGYSSSSSMLHLVKKNLSKRDYEYLVDDEPSKIEIFYNDNIIKVVSGY